MLYCCSQNKTLLWWTIVMVLYVETVSGSVLQSWLGLLVQRKPALWLFCIIVLSLPVKGRVYGKLVYPCFSVSCILQDFILSCFCKQCCFSDKMFRDGICAVFIRLLISSTLMGLSHTPWGLHVSEWKTSLPFFYVFFATYILCVFFFPLVRLLRKMATLIHLRKDCYLKMPV